MVRTCTTPRRGAADWTAHGRVLLGHEVIELAPAPPDHHCYTGWYAHQLGVAWEQQPRLKRLLDRMTTLGLLEKAGGLRTCRESCRVDVAWCERVGIDPTHVHLEVCHYRLAIDRHDAHERWTECNRKRGA